MKVGPAAHLWKPVPLLLEIPDTTWAYLAGIFDGEGFISTPRRRPTQLVGYRIGISQLASTGLCPWIQETLTYGTVCSHTSRSNPNLVQSWRGNAQSEVWHFLGHTLPYLRVKKDQAQEAYDTLLGIKIASMRSI